MDFNHSLAPPGKMVANLAGDIFKMYFWMTIERFPIQISLKFIPDAPVDNNQYWFR